MSIFQVISVLFALFMLYVVNIHRRKLHLSQLEVFFWYSIWVVFAIIAVFPELMIGIAGKLNFARVFDFLIVLALMVLTVIVVFSYFIQRENAKKLEHVVRSIAMKKALSKTSGK